jgi:hypothetical protein
MSNLDVACYVLGTLVTLYIVAATWRSRDAEPRTRDPHERRSPGK